MKSFLIFIALIVGSLAHHESHFTKVGEITGENFNKLEEFVTKTSNSKIASGVVAKRGENLEFCYITVQFLSKTSSCGCVLVDTQWVATSARCVYDSSELRATNITVTFPQLTGNAAKRTIQHFVIPDKKNIMGTLAAEYDATKDVPYYKIAGSNIAMIKLNDPVVNDGRTIQQATYGTYADFDSFKTATFATYKYRACGIGTINNLNEWATGLMCSDMSIVSNADCTALGLTIPDDSICLKWEDRDNNVCIGDYGGSVLAYKKDASGLITNQETFCVTIGSPDVRTGAKCLDAHTVVCMFIDTAKTAAWIKNIIAGKYDLQRNPLPGGK